MRTARSRISGENFGDFLILAPFSSEGASAKPGAVQIGSALREMALKVEEETALIQQDTLARGELVEAKNISAILRERPDGNYWSFNTDSLKTSVTDIDEVEYWGERWNFSTDFISSTSHYPWMPSSVSDEEFPF